MKNFTRRIVLGLTGAIILASSAIAGPLSGTYSAQGRNPDGSAYSGTVWIEDSDGVQGFKWKVGAQTYLGNGVRSGRVVTVDWGADAPVIYVVMDNGDLYGTWAAGTALEKLVRQ